MLYNINTTMITSLNNCWDEAIVEVLNHFYYGAVFSSKHVPDQDGIYIYIVNPENQNNFYQKVCVTTLDNTEGATVHRVELISRVVTHDV